MNYQQTLDYLYSQLPMFQRIGAAAYKSNLDNTIALDNLLGNLHKNYESIHIAGTNGKGSVSHFISSILQAKGLKVGLYTSPHLKDFKERIRINGEKIPENYVCDFVENYKSYFEKIKPSFFEMTFGMALKYFSDEKIDIAVFETGMGGRLDSTNIIKPLLSVITNIGFDHTAFLGNTLGKIAGEKAGIIKPNIPAIIGETQKEIKQIFIDKAKNKNTQIYFADDTFEAKNINYSAEGEIKLFLDVYKNNKAYINNLHCPLAGIYQTKNILTTLKIVELLNHSKLKIEKKHVIEGIENVITRTGIKGRWQVIAESPLTICDTAHNIDGAKEVVKQIKLTPHKTLHCVIGFVNDKNIESILKLLPKNAKYYFCKANIPRGLDENKLAKKANQLKLIGKAYSSVKNALINAQNIAKKDDLIFIGGSTFIVAEIIN